MPRLLLCFILLFGLFSALNSQTTIKGIIIDNNSGKKLPGVHILYKNSGTLSNPDGSYSIEVEPGSATISFSCMGYEATSRQVSVPEGAELHLNLSLMPAITSINEIVVTAGKNRQKMSDITVSMAVIKPFDLSKNHIINAEELIDKTPGIEITDGQASVRGGSGYSYGAGSRVLTLIDGLPALSTDAGNIKWSTLPIENVSRIEIIKGASSVLYGSSAINGVINFITRDARTEALTRLSLVTGLYDSPGRKEWKWWTGPRMLQNISFSHSLVRGNTGIGVGARLMNDDGYRKFNDEQNARININLKKESQKRKGLSYGLAINTSYTAKNDFLLWENADEGALIQSESTEMEYRGLSLALDPYLNFERDSTVSHRISSRLLSNFNRLPENSNNNSDSYSAYLEYHYSNRINSKLRLSAGSSQQYSSIISNFYGNHRGFNISAFSQIDYTFSKRLSGISGLRIEQYLLDGVFDRPVPIARAGINYKAGSRTFLRASFGQGYRYPSIAEKHAYTTVGAIRIFPNTEIRAEKGWSSEAGMRHDISAGLVSGIFDISLFYSRYRDMIEYVFGSYPDPLTDIPGLGFKPVNIENSIVYGMELDLSFNRPIGHFNNTLRGAYTLIFPYEVKRTVSSGESEFLKYRRKHSALISYDLGYKGFSSGISLYAKSKLMAIDDVFVNELSRETILPGFYDYWLENNTGFLTADFTISYRFKGMLTGSFNIKNLTNTEYMGRPGDIQPPRFFSVQVTKIFM